MKNKFLGRSSNKKMETVGSMELPGRVRYSEKHHNDESQGAVIDSATDKQLQREIARWASARRLNGPALKVWSGVRPSDTYPGHEDQLAAAKSCLALCRRASPHMIALEPAASTRRIKCLVRPAAHP